MEIRDEYGIMGLRDSVGYSLLGVIILVSVLILIGPFYYGYYLPSVLEVYSSLSCLELKEMLINSAEGLGPIFRGYYSATC